MDGCTDYGLHYHRSIYDSMCNMYHIYVCMAIICYDKIESSYILCCMSRSVKGSP